MDKSKQVIIGITGAFGSGKSTVASYFVSKGFIHIILSSFLEDEAKKRKVGTITRKILQDIGNELRSSHGKGILAQRALELIQKKKITKVVIDGIRNVGEIEVLRKYKGFILLAVMSDRKTRFDRLKSLKRREKLSWDLFNKLDSRDLGIGEEKTGLQVAFCIALADLYITNNNGKEKLYNNLQEFINK